MKRRHIWPDLLGATVKNSADAAFSGMRITRRPQNIQWAPTQANDAILARALMDVVNCKRRRRGDCEYDRAMVCADVIGAVRGPTLLYLYEAGYRDTIYPRYLWRLPDVPLSVGTAGVLWAAICTKVAAAEIVGEEDKRAPACVGEEPPKEQS